MANRFFLIAMGGYGLTLAPDPVWALQAHGGAEGLVSHQIGHMLFASAMGYLFFRLQRIEQRGLGWLEFKLFLWLIIAWNLLTFSGHWLNEITATDKFIKVMGKTVLFTVTEYADAVYYLTRFDHFLLIPAFLFLLLALRKWRMQE